MLKKLFMGVALLALLLVIAAVAVVMFVDVNRFKPQIENFVQQQYDRKLTIAGDLSLGLWPKVAVALPAMTLSEPRQPDTKAMSLTSARVSVKLMPLLSGKLQADTIGLTGLTATILRRADGSMSIDDLIGAGGEKTLPAASTESTPANSGASSPIALADIEIGGLELTDATIVFDDRQAKNRIQLKNLNLTAGPIADRQQTPVKLAVDASMTNPKLALNVALESKLAVAFIEQQLTAQTLLLKIKGTFDDMPLNQTVKASNLVATAVAVSADALSLSGGIDQGARKIAYEINSPFTINLEDGNVALSKLAGEFRLDDKAVAPEPVVVPLSGSVKANTKSETLNAVLALAARDVKLDAKVDVKGFAKPAIAFDIAADRIDVDKFLPPAPAAGTEKPAQLAPAAGPATDTPIDLSALDTLDLTGRVRVGELIAAGAKVQALDLSVKAKSGTATVEPISAQLYSGGLKGRAVATSAGNRISLATNLTGIEIGPLLTDIADTDLLTGKGDVSIDIRTDGKTVSALKRSLDGKASLRLADGAIKGINLGERIRDIKQLLGRGEAESVSNNAQARTDFTALTASFNIVNGVATNTDLDGKTPLLRLSGGGKIDIAASTIDYLAKAALVGTSKGQGGREVEELRGVTIPVKLTGSFDSLAWAIDWSEAAKEALKSRAAQELGIDKAAIDAKKAELKARAEAEEAKAREQLRARADAEEAKVREQLKTKEQELKDKAAGKINEKLKGLFN